MILKRVIDIEEAFPTTVITAGFVERESFVRSDGKRKCSSRRVDAPFHPLYRDAPILQKFLAKDRCRSQTRSAMSRFARSTNQGRAFIAICVFTAFLWALALSASPQLHQRVHKDASRVEHSCAATMIASGSYNHAAHPPLVSAPVPAIQFSKIPALTPQWVESPFLGACIFEHAPPARG
jgi:hypothetical protein